jgi:hypothetical protein
MKVAWERLIRFVATDGRVLRGEPILPSPDFDLGSTTAETGLKAKVIEGSDLYDTTGATRVTDEVVVVKQLLGPLAQEDVPILRCVGLNYAKHSKCSSPQDSECSTSNSNVRNCSGRTSSSSEAYMNVHY